ncbi:MAG: hypothetical protein Kow0069_04040 [Promethearchaeota archaeon]
MKEIFIIDKATSTTIFHYSWQDVGVDADLLSGMLSALNSLSEVELRGQGIESIMMGGLSWVYTQHEALNLLAISASDRHTNVEIMRNRLDVVLQMFLKEFGVTEENWGEIWKGEYSKFVKFEHTVRQLIEQWDMAESALGAAELFDMLGVFQQVFYLMSEVLTTNFFGERLAQAAASLGRFYEKLRLEQLKDNAELEKIAFDPVAMEFNVLGVNPQFVNSSKLKRSLLSILAELKRTVTRGLGRMMALEAFAGDVFPFLAANLDMFVRLDVAKEVLDVFLVTGEGEKGKGGDA